MQAAAVADLADLGDHPIHRLERPRRYPAADQNGGDDADDEGDQDRREELLQPQLCGAGIRARENRAELLTGVRHGAHDVMQRRPVRLDPETPREVRRGRLSDGGRGGRGGREGPCNRVELLELRKRQRAGIRRREQEPAVAARHEQVIGHHLEHGRDLLHQHRPPRGVLLHQHSPRVIALGQNAGRQVGFGLDAAIEILVGGAAPGEIQDNRKDRDAEDEGAGVPDGHPPTNALHVYARTTYPTPRTVWISLGSFP